MRVSDAVVKKLLKESGKISAEDLKKLNEKADSEKKPLQEVAVREDVISEEELTRLYAQEIDVPMAEFAAGAIPVEILQLIPEKVAHQYRSVAFNLDGDGVVYVAMEDPDDIQAINFLQKQIGRPIRVHIVPEATLLSALDQYGGNTSVSSELAKVIEVEDREEAKEVAEEDVAEDSPIAQTVNVIIDYGIRSRASDVHIEPQNNEVVVRYRIDGVLHESNKLPGKLLNALVSRIKILASLKIDEHRAPQDGRFKISVNNHIYALRVSTLPIIDGEKVVMRILDESTKAAEFEELGFWGGSLERVQKAIKEPHGMVLVTGPTGSGKSTSLFSVLSKLNNPSVNISTIEDPVEYRITGVNQTQVNPIAGMTFANGLRALLRQDPNIIMVGEIRDSETADLGVQAALTGHLVFTTLHTNDAATCLPRLLDMGVEPFLIASTVRVIIGQRLVRRLCPNCKEEYAPTKEVVERIKSSFNLTKPTSFSELEKLEKEAMEAGVGASDLDNKGTASTKLSTSGKSFVRLWQASQKGCNECSHSGYHGRIGIYEVLDNNPGIQKLIVTDATSEAIQVQAVSDGMVTMRLDGLIKALRGQTTVEEIMRATSTEE